MFRSTFAELEKYNNTTILGLTCSQIGPIPFSVVPCRIYTLGSEPFRCWKHLWISRFLTPSSSARDSALSSTTSSTSLHNYKPSFHLLLWLQKGSFSSSWTPLPGRCREKPVVFIVAKRGCAHKVCSNPPECTYSPFYKPHFTLDCTNIEIS
jgi:hypothetical protein